MGQDWLPKPEKNEIFQTEGPIYAVSFLECGANEITLKCEADTPFTCFIDGEAIFSASKSMEEKLHIKEGTHRISVLFETAPTVFDMGAENAALFLPDFIKGVRGKFCLLKPTMSAQKMDLMNFCCMANKIKRNILNVENILIYAPFWNAQFLGRAITPLGCALWAAAGWARFG